MAPHCDQDNAAVKTVEAAAVAAAVAVVAVAAAWWWHAAEVAVVAGWRRATALERHKGLFASHALSRAATLANHAAAPRAASGGPPARTMRRRRSTATPAPEPINARCGVDQ